MKYEVLKRSHLKRNIIIAVIIILILSAIILTFTQAKYKTTASIPLVNGTINYDLSDLNLIGVYIQEGEEYIQTNEIPSSGYEFNAEESYCTINNERDDNITLSFDMTTQNLTVTPLTTKGTKCYLYFDEKLSAGDTILASGNAPTGQTTDWTNNGQGVTYYYTGANPNNWVSFAGFWWRIIRINGDGSIRMIYQGVADSATPDSGNITGTGTQIGTSAFDSDRNNKTHVGLVYDGSTQHGYGQPSSIMTTLNNWYNSNIENDDKNLHYEQYIDTGAGFCSDRNTASGDNYTDSRFYYAAYDRYNGPASLQCHDDDILSQDNGKLPNPIGLVTSDEAVLTGITRNTPNTGSYLYTGQNYWTMSPYIFNGGCADVFHVGYNGYLSGGNGVYVAFGVRPVINLKSTIAISGSGTTTDPFKVVGAE